MQSRERVLAFFGQPDTRRAVNRLAFPCIMESLLMALVQYVDTAMVGSLGAASTAAVAINASPMWLLNGLMTAVGVGGTALVARAIGAGNRREAEDACGQVLLGACLLGTLFTLAALALGDVLPRWMGAEPDVQPLAAAYLRIISLGFLPHYVGVALAAVLRGAGDTRTPMLLTSLANGLNVLGNFLLIYPTRTVTVLGAQVTIWGAGWGVSGAAASTAACTALAGVALFVLMQRPVSRLRLRPRGLRPMPVLLRRMLRVGGPAALERIAINLGQIVFARMIAAFGTVALAAYHLSITVESLAYMPGYGMSSAATTLVGQSLGAREPEQAERYGRTSARMGIAYMTLASVVMLLLANTLIGIFTDDPDVVRIGANLIRICAGYEPFFALAIVLTGALRGAGDTRSPFLLAMFSMWVVRMGVAALCAFGLGWGIYGAWAGMFADLVVRGLLLQRRFKAGHWKTLEV